eukprot:4079859-Pyramimonas_sp.AAC.1
MQRRFEDMPDQMLMAESGAREILSRLDAWRGERHGDDRRKAGRECLFGYKRKTDEFLSQHSVRVQQQFDQLGVQGL